MSVETLKIIATGASPITSPCLTHVPSLPFQDAKILASVYYDMITTMLRNKCSSNDRYVVQLSAALNLELRGNDAIGILNVSNDV